MPNSIIEVLTEEYQIMAKGKDRELVIETKEKMEGLKKDEFALIFSCGDFMCPISIPKNRKDDSIFLDRIFETAWRLLQDKAMERGFKKT